MLALISLSQFGMAQIDVQSMGRLAILSSMRPVLLRT
jgi:hypothetical protein